MHTTKDTELQREGERSFKNCFISLDGYNDASSCFCVCMWKRDVEKVHFIHSFQILFLTFLHCFLSLSLSFTRFGSTGQWQRGISSPFLLYNSLKDMIYNVAAGYSSSSFSSGCCCYCWGVSAWIQKDELSGYLDAPPTGSRCPWMMSRSISTPPQSPLSLSLSPSSPLSGNRLIKKWNCVCLKVSACRFYTLIQSTRK